MTRKTMDSTANSATFYAHSIPGEPQSSWHELYSHLADTADRARQFGEAFGAGEWAYLAGLWHDLGKYSSEFQRRITGDPDAHCEEEEGETTAPSYSRRPDHSTAGALHAWGKDKARGLPLAFAIAGHHGGLLNLHEALRPRLENKGPLYEQLPLNLIPEAIKVPSLPDAPHWLSKKISQGEKEALRLSYELWIRFLYSALVDADFLDTEAFLAPEKAALRGVYPTLSELLEKLRSYLSRLSREASDTLVNRLRVRALESCWAAAPEPPGVFSLTVPTGGGKTLSSMGFALQHAIYHGLRRVIVVIPYTSIIEQNAAQYREVFGPEAVVEHHSNLDPAKEDYRNRLACENWDAPVIVTTSVQFLESLFANRSSRCRKLHNIARSVVIFDEVQTLRIGLLLPILDALKELTSHYGVSLLLCTATQPAFRARPSEVPGQAFPGFEEIREIIPQDLARDFRQLRRVSVRLPRDLSQKTTWEELASRINEQRQVLVVVHRRQDARDLVRLLPEDALHLSALMCPAHRSDIIQEVKRRLKEKEPCRLISTQLIEAGVDVDFPVVYRALGGADLLAQASGRCNREGTLKDDSGNPVPGHFEAFVAPTDPPRGTPKMGLEQTIIMIRLSGGGLDIFASETYEAYFRRLYGGHTLDEKGIQTARAALNFKDVGRKFQLIEDEGTTPVIVPYGGSSERLRRLEKEGPTREGLRALQPYIVTLYQQDVERLRAASALATVREIVTTLASTHDHLYDSRFGLVVDGPLAADPDRLIQ